MSIETWDDHIPEVSVLNSLNYLMLGNPTVGEEKTVKMLTDNLISEIGTKLNGPTIKYINSIDDLPPLIGGFRKLEQNTVYKINAEIFLSDDILVPAGWNGIFTSDHLPRNNITYLGSGSLLNTLNINGIIDSFAQSIGSPGVKTTVTTSSPHGLSAGDTININGVPTETGYNNRRLIVSNVTASTFDIEIVFTATDTGLFDTGYLAMQFLDVTFFNSGAGTLFNLSAIQDIESLFSVDTLVAFNFSSLGTIRNAPACGIFKAFMTFINNGITFDNCDTIGYTDSNLTNINPASTTSKNLTITGSATRDVVIANVKFNVSNIAQRPIRIDGGTVNNADAITIQTCPDNAVAANYFDTLSGGLDQTDKQVITFNNGKRENSAELSESMSNGVLIVPSGVVGVADPIQKAVPVAGDFTLDSTTEGFTLDNATGIVTYDGRATKRLRIEYSLEAAQFSGSAQDLDIDLRINTVPQAKTMRSMSTMGVGAFTPISYLGGFFIINPGDTFQLFKTNNTNTTDTDIQNVVLLIR